MSLDVSLGSLPVSDALLAWLAGAAAKGAVALALALAAARLLRGASAATRHAVLAAAVVAQLGIPILGAALPAWQVALPFHLPSMEADELPAVADAPPAPRPAAFTAADAEPAVGAPAPAAEVVPASLDRDGAAGPTSDGASISSGAAAIPPRLSWATIAVLVWAAGALAVLVRLLIGTIHLRVLARYADPVVDPRWLTLAERTAAELGVGRPIRLLRGDRLSIPVTWGVRRPVVLLPADAERWPEARRRAVIVHELAHVARWDLATQLAAQLALAAFWFDPLLWMALRAMRSEGERACDDVVLRAGTLPSAYVTELLEMVRNGQTPAAPAFAAMAMARRSEFEGRMLAILDGRAPRAALRGRGTLLVAALMLVVALPLAAARPVAADAASSNLLEGSRLLVDTAAGPAGGERAARIAGSATTPYDGGGTASARAATMKTAVANAAAAVGTAVGTLAAEVPRAVAQVLSEAGPDSPDAGDMPASAREAGDDTADAVADAVAVAALLDALDDPDPAVRLAVLRALAERREARAVPGLAAALGDRDVAVRVTAARALGEIDDPRAIAALSEALRRDTDAEVREAAAWALGEIEDPAAIPALADALRQDREVKVRRQAAWALGQIEDARAVPALGPALRDADLEVRRMAVWALGQVESADAVPVLLPLLSDDDGDVRKQTAWALGQIESRAAVEGLVRSLRDRDAEVRSMAAWALGEIEDPAAAAGLSAALRDTTVDVRRKAAWALGELELSQAPPALIEATRDADRQVRQGAAHALGEIEDPAAVPALATLARSGQDVESRRVAVRALAEIRGPEAVQVLVELLKDQDPQIRQMAARALGER